MMSEAHGHMHLQQSNELYAWVDSETVLIIYLFNPLINILIKCPSVPGTMQGMREIKIDRDRETDRDIETERDRDCSCSKSYRP